MEKHIFTAPTKIEAINNAKKNLVETEKNLLIVLLLLSLRSCILAYFSWQDLGFDLTYSF